MSNAANLYQGKAGEEYWERNAPLLDKEQRVRSETLRSLVTLPLDQASSPWLEVGCGRGHNLLSYDVGLDCDVRQLRYLPARDIIPILGEAWDLSMFPDGSFPVVFSVGCLMHLPTHKHPMLPMLPSQCVSWQRAAAEMARVSSRTVILGEYMSEKETVVPSDHWPAGTLWSRPYVVPGMREVKRIAPLPPFDPHVSFSIWKKAA